jgi:hypothetical protein
MYACMHAMHVCIYVCVKLLCKEKSDCEAALWMLNRLEVCMHTCMYVFVCVCVCS